MFSFTSFGRLLIRIVRREDRSVRAATILVMFAGWLASLCGAVDAADFTPESLVDQANAPISSMLQIRLQDSYAPQFQGLKGQGNTVQLTVTSPLPPVRLLPITQLSLLTFPLVNTLPGGITGTGDIRFADLASLPGTSRFAWGIGPTFVFPTASSNSTGQGKWQAGPAVGAGFRTRRLLVGVLAQNPISFGGDPARTAVNSLYLQPFIVYQLGGGWFIRSEPQMIFNWLDGRQLLPVDLGFGRVFYVRRQAVSCFIEPAWNVSHDTPAPRYAITFGFTLIYPRVWQR